MPNIGTLVTRVYTSRTQLPIKDATVSILQITETGQTELVAVRTTDQNGKTTPVAIATPDFQDSLSANQKDMFALCDVWAEHPKYQIIEIKNVQIFPSIESVQEIPMIPLSRSQNSYIGVDGVDIPLQDL